MAFNGTENQFRRIVAEQKRKYEEAIDVMQDLYLGVDTMAVIYLLYNLTVQSKIYVDPVQIQPTQTYPVQKQWRQMQVHLNYAIQQRAMNRQTNDFDK